MYFFLILTTSQCLRFSANTKTHFFFFFEKTQHHEMTMKTMSKSVTSRWYCEKYLLVLAQALIYLLYFFEIFQVASEKWLLLYGILLFYSIFFIWKIARLKRPRFTLSEKDQAYIYSISWNLTYVLKGRTSREIMWGFDPERR